MVQPPSLVGFLPIGGAITPPSVELLVVGHEFAQRVNPGACGLSAVQFIDLDWRVAHNAEERLMAPDVVLTRRDVQVADEDRPLRRRLFMHTPIDHFVNEGEFVGEFDVDFGVRLVAPSGHVEIVKLEPFGSAAQDHMQMTRVPFGAKVSLGGGRERYPRNNRNPVVALLPIDGDMRIARVTERPEGEIAVWAFRLLQTQNVGLVLA
jgi:hypothetical protein